MQSKKSYTVDEAKLALERYCIYQDRCHKEVEEKLRKMQMIPEAQELIIIHLLQHNFLNETRFAKSYVRGKFTIKKWGKNKIKNQLYWKGISSYNIKVGLSEIDAQDYMDILYKLAEKKEKVVKAKNEFEKRKKLTNYLVGKGYEFDLVLETIRELLMR